MISFDEALETVRKVHHREMREYKQAVCDKIDEIGWSADPLQELAKFKIKLSEELRSSSPSE